MNACQRKRLRLQELTLLHGSGSRKAAGAVLWFSETTHIALGVSGRTAGGIASPCCELLLLMIIEVGEHSQCADTPSMAKPNQPPGLIQRYREELQVRHYARRTMSSYEHWLRRFLRFHRMRHPREMGEVEVNAFLCHLATEKRVSACTQNQALAALLFFYRTMLGGDMGNLEGVIRARRRPPFPWCSQ